MKRIIISIIAILLPLLASATYINDINYDLNSSTKTATVIQGSYSGNINIRSHVTYSGVTYTVTSIGKEAFSNSDITSVTIPSTVTFINKRAFGGCTKLTSVSIPNSVTEIAAAAFYGSTALKNIVLPSGLKKIDENLFWGCTSLTSVTIPAGVTSIGEEAFRECLALPSITIPSSVTEIGERAFEGCTSLKKIISEIQEPFAISDNVFGGIASDATLSVLEGTKTAYQNTAGWNVFSDGTTEIQTKRTIHVATAGTLPQLISLEKYYIEELKLTGYLNGTDIACIRRMAGAPVNYDRERGGAYMEEESGKVFGKLCVLDISGATIVLGGDYYYKLWVDMDYENDYHVRDDESTSNNTISRYMFMDCKLANISLPNNITKIESGAFRNCKSLTEIVIPQSVISIGYDAFSGCNSLTSMKVESGNLTYDSRNNCNAIIEKSSNTLIAGCKNTIIPNSVASIGSNAFSDCSGLTSIEIPNSVASIGGSAFSGCTDLTSVTISNNVISIGDAAFYNCSSLTSVTIPSSVTSIGNYAFYNCSSLKTVISEIENPFDNTNYMFPNEVLSFAKMIVPKGTKGKYQTAEGWKQFKNIIEIGGVGYEFEADGILYKIGVNNTVSVISGYNKNSGDVMIPEKVTFDGASYTMTVIGQSAFSGYKGLTSVAIPNSVTSIEEFAFIWCSGLTSLTIPNSVRGIGDDAFRGCTGLTSITLGSSVTYIGAESFVICMGVTKILSLNNTPPSYPSIKNTTFDFTKCVLWVPKGKGNAYKEAGGAWTYFKIREIIDGDVNLDGEVNQADVDAIVDFIMDKDPEDFFESLADLNGDDKVDAADVVKLVTILNLQEGLNMDWQANYSNQVISSLSCTLNNDGDKAIQLTKCELYCNQSLVSSANFKVTLASGGSKKCSFDELASYSTRTGFSLVWYYTYNGEDYTYRYEIEE